MLNFFGFRRFENIVAMIASDERGLGFEGGIRTLFIFSMKLSAMRLLEIALLTPWKLHRNSEESSKNGKVRTSLDVDYQPLRVEIS